MKNNETGEFELVVGNRQLLSGFFIVVLLFAVAFAMGYVLGQNSPRSARIAAETPSTGGMASSANTRPQPASPASAPVTSPVPTADAAAGQPPPDAPPQPTTKAVEDPANAAPPVNAAPQTAPASAIMSSTELPAGSYWQAIAVKPSVAEAIRQTLKDKGFQVSLTPATASLTRVLVGPYGDTTALGRAKTDLESAGFQPVRYKRD